MITDGKKLIVVFNKGSLKRCGGIGDILTGVVSTFVAMVKKNSESGLTTDSILDACAAACYLNRDVSEAAFNKFGIALTAPDIIESLVDTMKNYPSKF